MDSILEALKSSVTRVKPENLEMKITGIQQKWRGVEHKYETYYLEVNPSISFRTSRAANLNLITDQQVAGLLSKSLSPIQTWI
jgi:hypothetical protein